MFAIFNSTKQFLYVADAPPVDDKYIYKELDDFIFGRDRWVGDFDNGYIIRLNAPVPESLGTVKTVTKTMVANHTSKNILKHYDIHDQLNIICNCIEGGGTTLTPEFIKMREFLTAQIDQYNNTINISMSADDIHFIDDTNMSNVITGVYEEFSEFKEKV